MSIILKPVSDLYKKLVNVEGENAYPWLDRTISYVLPTAGAVLWSAFGKHNGYDLSTKQGATWGLPVGLAFYGASQGVLTYAKPFVEVKESDSVFTKTVKEVSAIGIKLVDALNNTVPYTIAFNMLPTTAGLNEVAAFRVMPAMVSAIESDIKAYINGSKYEGTIAGPIFATAAAGFGAANLRDFVVRQVIDPAPLSKIPTETGLEVIVKEQNIKSMNSMLTGTLVESTSYPFFKKLLMTTQYQANEIEQDILKGILKEVYKTSSQSKIFTFDSLKDSVFEGIPLFVAAECVLPTINFISSGIASMDLDFCDQHPEICATTKTNDTFSISTAVITESL